MMSSSLSYVDDDGSDLYHNNKEKEAPRIEEETPYSTFLCLANEFNAAVRKAVLEDIDEYKAPWWFSPTMAILEYRCPVDVNFEREILSHSNGASFAVDWSPSKPTLEKDLGVDDALKIVIYTPGLGGDTDKTMVQKFCQVLHKSGYYTAVVNQRGKKISLTTKDLWRPGISNDVDLVIERLTENLENQFSSFQSPKSTEFRGKKVRVFLAGASAGTSITKNVLLKRQFGENLGTSLDIRILGALALCICYDYRANREQMESTYLGSVLSSIFVNQHRDVFQRHVEFHKEYPEWVVEKALKCSKISEYDAHASVNLYGLQCEQEYIDSVSNFDLDSMKFPYLTVQPADDPIYNGNVRGSGGIDVLRLVSNPNIIYLEPKQGGHLAFYEGSLFGHLCKLEENNTSYSYPARVSTAFFDCLLHHEKALLLRADLIK